MKTETRTITFGAAAIAVVASFLAGAYMADGYRTPPARTFGVSDAVAAPEAIPGPKATSAPAAKIVELLETQLKAVKVAVASEREFPIEKSAGARRRMCFSSASYRRPTSRRFCLKLMP